MFNFHLSRSLVSYRANQVRHIAMWLERSAKKMVRVLVLSICLVLVLNVVRVHASTPSEDSQPYRTGYHFQPPKNWINGTYFISTYIIYSNNSPTLRSFEISIKPASCVVLEA